MTDVLAQNEQVLTAIGLVFIIPISLFILFMLVSFLNGLIEHPGLMLNFVHSIVLPPVAYYGLATGKDWGIWLAIVFYGSLVLYATRMLLIIMTEHVKYRIPCLLGILMGSVMVYGLVIGNTSFVSAAKWLFLFQTFETVFRVLTKKKPKEEKAEEKDNLCE